MPSSYEAFSRIFTLILGLLAIIAAAGTYYVASLHDDLEFRTRVLFYFFCIDVLLLAIIFFIVIRKIINLWLERNRSSTRLYRQTIFLFSLVAIIPAVFLFVFNYFFLNKGIESWFADPVRSAIHASQKITDFYLEDNMKNLKLHANSIVLQLRPQMAYLVEHPLELKNTLSEIADEYHLSEALIFDANKQKDIARSYLTIALPLEKITFKDFEKVIANEEVLIKENDRLRVLIKLDHSTNTYLFLGKILNPGIIQNMEQTRIALKNFSRLQVEKFDLQIAVTLILSIVTLLLVLIAIWFGLNISDRLMQPITNLIDAVHKIKSGDWKVRVVEPENKNELNVLIRTFNMMLDQLYEQHRTILREKNINETIIASVSAGIIGFDFKGIVHLANAQAEDLLHKKYKDIIGSNIGNVFFELKDVFRDFLEKRLSNMNYKIVVRKKNGLRTFQVYLGIQKGIDGRYIATFNDVTDLLVAQKNASWSEIARRIAHEIKNPLTPIQLSAERLKRRYLKIINQEDQSVFKDCIDVIIRQVHIIFNLVKQFTSFANIRSLDIEKINVTEMCEKLITFFIESHEKISFEFIQNLDLIDWFFDIQQMQQALLNLFNNAVAILEGEEVQNPKVRLSLIKLDNELNLIVEDNGPGFPEEIIHKLTEPYVTMRKDGTGLGLAIVEKIIQDHKGCIYFSKSSTLGGAKVIITFEAVDKNVRQKDVKA